MPPSLHRYDSPGKADLATGIAPDAKLAIKDLSKGAQVRFHSEGAQKREQC